MPGEACIFAELTHSSSYFSLIGSALGLALGEDHLVEVRLEGVGNVCHLAHMGLRLGVLEHRLEVLATAPLRVVGHPLPVEALVDVGRDEARLVPHHRLGGLDQEIDELFLPLRLHSEHVDEGHQRRPRSDHGHADFLAPP
jgi:hypothetical protein